MPSRNLLTVIASAIITVTLGGVTSVGLATEVKGVNFSVTASAAVAPAVTDVTLTANTATGDAMLVFNNPSAQFYAWELTSSTGGLSYTNLTDLPKAVKSPWSHVAPEVIPVLL